jgi:hypothetical protein
MATDFPAPPRLNRQGTKFPRAITWLLIAGCIAAAFLLWEFGKVLYRGDKQANVAVQHFHQELNDSEYEQIYQEADAGFREASTHNDVIKLLQSVHTRLGNATASSVTRLDINSDAKGTFVTAAYNSTFARGSAVETFKWLRKGTDLTLYSYNVRSNVFDAQ